ncbi:MAG: ADP-ribose pyrophosphatase [Bacillota bacterium]|nr:MAG: ADP-ribose pyrophosphatase [Bacillota bacterium]
MDFTEKTVEKNTVYAGKILSVRNDVVLLPDGKTSRREIVEHNGGSCVLAVKEGKILFVKQFRYAMGEVLYEIPAGKLEKGENPESTAVRELEEECGLKAHAVELLYVTYPTPGYSEEKIYIYRCRSFGQGTAHPDENEFLTGEWIEEKEVKKMMKDGRIRDGKTLIALLHYFAETPQD